MAKSKKKIIITIRPDGTVDFEAHGYKGDGCQKAIDALSEGLGTTISNEKKPEYEQKEKKLKIQKKQKGRQTQ